MTPEKVHIIVFSPTGTSRKIARAISQGISSPHEPELLDLTHNIAQATTFSAHSLVVIAAPVYGGHIAPVALERMQELHGEGTPAIVVAVYGNRDIGKAGEQLAAFVAGRGFVPIAAAAFVGEHSYSTPGLPIAEGRPDAQDLAKATAFGASVGAKIAVDGIKPVDASRLRAPRTPLFPLLRFIRFVVGYRRSQKRNPVVLLPVTDAGRCTHCSRCAALCPTEAIARGKEELTDATRCIRCCACVKGCPVGARRFDTPFGAALARNFARRKEPVTQL